MNTIDTTKLLSVISLILSERYGARIEVKEGNDADNQGNRPAT